MRRSSPTLAFRLAGTDHAITIREHPRTRRVRLKVLPPGRVEAVVPRGFGVRRLQRFIEQNRDWLAKTLTEVVSRWQRQATFPETVHLPAVAMSWKVEEAAGTRGVTREGRDGSLRVEGQDETARIHALRRWLARKARHHLEPWLQEVSGRTGLRYHSLGIRAQRTRWGSCSATGRINLNSGLMFLAPPLVEYVMVHELCHTRHLDHSAAFWALVAVHAPSHREVERQLRRADLRIPLWFRYP